VIAFGRQTVFIQGQYVLGASAHAQVTALAILFIDFDPSLYGHSILLGVIWENLDIICQYNP
jgi:hypothetical protein